MKRKRTFKRRTRKGKSFRRSTRKSMRRIKKRNPLSKVVMNPRRHPVLDRSSDRDHVWISQKYSSTMIIDWLQSGSAIGGSTDGFFIPMNQITNTFNGLSIPDPTLPRYGVPVAKQTLATQGFIPQRFGSTGNVSVAGNVNPDGFIQLLNRYSQVCVTGGVFTIKVSQDSEGGSTSTGSTRLAVCAFPCVPDIGEVFTSLGNGHYIYPPSPGTITSQADVSSIEGLCNEPNCRKATLSPFAGSRTDVTIRYPFTMNKYAPPGYWTSAAYYVSAPNFVAGTIPPATFVPRILVQMQSDGSRAAQTYRLEMTMKWKVTCFERYPVVSVL